MIRALLLTPFIASGLALAFLAFANRRALRNRTDELSAEGADEGGFIFQHDRSNTDAHP